MTLADAADSVIGDRVIASAENQQRVNPFAVYLTAEARGLKYIIVDNIDGDTKDVVFFRPGAEIAASLYRTYIRNQDVWTAERTAGLTLREHRKLGKAFGLPKEDIDWFIAEMRAEL